VLVAIPAAVFGRHAAGGFLHGIEPLDLSQTLFGQSLLLVLTGHTIRGLVTLGADEIAYCKGRKYATIIYDLDRSHVVWVGQGKGRETIDRFFNESLSEHQRLKIKWASCDMSRAYTGAIQHHCPNATLVIDRFHVVKALNEALVGRPERRVAGTG
jgi:transposase